MHFHQLVSEEALLLASQFIRILLVQRNCEQAMDFCERKVTEMKKRIDEVGEDIKGKEGALQQVEALLQQRIAEAKAQEQSAASDPLS